MRLYRVRQKLVSNPIRDIPLEVRRQLDGLKLKVPAGEVAITAGSRGIRDIAVILRTVGQWLAERGARPFIVPCMGSHGGATADGQTRALELLGVTRESTGLEVRSCMETVKLDGASGREAFMDGNCWNSAGVLVVNRVKLHTCFSGPIQSGLTKMMVVGMGKIRGARHFHSFDQRSQARALRDIGRVVLESGRILAGLAVIEDGFDQTAELHALEPGDIPGREPELLAAYDRYFPRLPADDLNVLVVNEIGKVFSGSGMDTNVIGYRGIRGFEDLSRPRIRVIAALNLSDKSYGNAFGVGLADFITRRLRDSIDEEKTLVNVLTSGEMIRMKIPATLPDDETLVRTIAGRFGEKRWMFIPNTLELGVLYASEDLAGELDAGPVCETDPRPVELTFRNGRHELRFE